MLSAPHLTTSFWFIHLSRSVYLDCDSSENCIGAQLSQLDEGWEVIFSYSSVSLSIPRTSYCATHHELSSPLYCVCKYTICRISNILGVLITAPSRGWLGSGTPEGSNCIDGLENGDPSQYNRFSHPRSQRSASHRSYLQMCCTHTVQASGAQPHSPKKIRS